MAIKQENSVSASSHKDYPANEHTSQRSHHCRPDNHAMLLRPVDVRRHFQKGSMSSKGVKKKGNHLR
jgi:hypothetical protein